MRLLGWWKSTIREGGLNTALSAPARPDLHTACLPRYGIGKEDSNAVGCLRQTGTRKRDKASGFWHTT